MSQIPPTFPPQPPPQPVGIFRNFIQTQPITPVRLQGQRWRNWALTRLSHLPANEEYTDARNLEQIDVGHHVDTLQLLPVVQPAVAVVHDEDRPDVVHDGDQPNEVLPEAHPHVQQRKVIGAKPVKECKRKLAYEVPLEEKSKCKDGRF